MSHAAPPALTVRYDGSQRTFAAGHDIVVGRDLRADMRITHPLISRAHLLLRFDQGRWLAIDNGSLNGTYVHGRRVPVIDIHDGQTINIGNPDGPTLNFEIGRHDGIAGRHRPRRCRSPGPAPPPGRAPDRSNLPARRRRDRLGLRALRPAKARHRARIPVGRPRSSLTRGSARPPTRSTSRRPCGNPRQRRSTSRRRPRWVRRR
jgi:hypothetical protein